MQLVAATCCTAQRIQPILLNIAQMFVIIVGLLYETKILTDGRTRHI